MVPLLAVVLSQARQGESAWRPRHAFLLRLLAHGTPHGVRLVCLLVLPSEDPDQVSPTVCWNWVYVRGVSMIDRLDAVLHEPPPERRRHTIGRPRVVGKHLPTLEQVLQDPETVWQKLTLDWYGEGERTVEIGTGTALWYRLALTPYLSGGR